MQLLMSRLSQGTDSRQVYGSPGKHNYKLHPHHKPWERLTLSLRFPRQSGFADSPFPAGREKRREESVLERSEREYWTGKEGCTALIPVYTRAFHEMGSSFCREVQVKERTRESTGFVHPVLHSPAQARLCHHARPSLGCVTCSELLFVLFFISSPALHSWSWEINTSRTGQPVLDRVTQGVQHMDLGHCDKDQM